MSRPRKVGLEYWGLDCDFFQNKKIRLIQGQFGVKGVYLTIFLLNELYRDKGYYKEWDRDDSLLMAGLPGVAGDCTPNLIEDVVQGLVRRSFFDKGIFDRFHVLTSAGIQRRFLHSARKRDVIPMIREYFLLDMPREGGVLEGTLKKVALISLSAPETPVSVPETPIPDAEKPTSTVQHRTAQYSTEQHTTARPSLSSGSGDVPEEGTHSGGRTAKPVRNRYGPYRNVLLTDVELDRLLRDLGDEEVRKCISYVDESAQTTGNRNGWKDWNLVIRRCSREQWHRRAFARNAPVSQREREEEIRRYAQELSRDSEQYETGG